MKTHGRTRPSVMKKTQEMVPYAEGFIDRVEYNGNIRKQKLHKLWDWQDFAKVYAMTQPYIHYMT